MILDRRTFTAEKGRRRDAVAMAKEVAELFTSKFGVTYRIYTTNIGPFDAVAVEGEFESLAEYDRLWTEFLALPELAPLMDKWNEVTETGGTHEIWELEE